jgi:hypothetical protein
VKAWLLDTNVVSELRKPRPTSAVAEFVAAQPGELLFTTEVTFGEIRFGIEQLEDPGRRTDTVIGNGNAGLFEGLLYLDDGREVSAHNAFGLFDPLEGGEAATSPVCNLVSDIASAGGHSRGTLARTTLLGNRALASGSARVNSSRDRKAGGLSTMTTPRSASEAGRKTGSCKAKCADRCVHSGTRSPQR